MPDAVKGAKIRGDGFAKPFKARSFFRPTQMSAEMAAAGLIPDIHLVRELSCRGVLKHKHDKLNMMPSAHVAF